MLRRVSKRMRYSVTSAFSMTLFCTSSAQVHNAKSTTSKGTITGRVFAITNAGDLKPARMAEVHILYLHGVGRARPAGEGETAGMIYMEESNKASELYMKQLDASGASWSDKMLCMNDLHTFEPVILKVIDWASVHKKTAQLISTQTDEEGRFSTLAPPGEYIVLVRGRAGYNEALWDTNPLNDIQVGPGARVEVKLGSPTKSCPAVTN